MDDDVPGVVAPWRPTPAEVARVEAEHRERVRRLDPLAAVPDLLLPGTDLDDLLAIRLPDGSRAMGTTVTTEVGAGQPAALFRALREHRLRARAAGPDVTGAVAALVDAWAGSVRDDGPHHDGTQHDGPRRDGTQHDVARRGGPRRVAPRGRGLCVVWPSRDVEAVAALAGSGLRATAHLAAWRADRGAPVGGTGGGAPAGVVLRDAAAADVDAVARHQLAELVLDDLVGSARLRDDAAGLLRAEVRAAVGREDTTVLVAEDRSGAIVGVVAVEPPRLSGAVAGAVSQGPVAYVVVLHVDPGARGAGVGAALVDAALARVRRDVGPATTVLLHHGVLNPLSAPFWARHGFRPVLTTWELPVGATT